MLLKTAVQAKLRELRTSLRVKPAARPQAHVNSAMYLLESKMGVQQEQGACQELGSHRAKAGHEHQSGPPLSGHVAWSVPVSEVSGLRYDPGPHGSPSEKRR